MVPLADLRPWETNYRHHPAEQLDRIRESLRRNGQRKAVVVQASTMRIVAGHGVAEAMRLEGYTEARCDVWDCSDEQAAAYLVDDNELSRHAVDDDAALAALLLGLQDTQYAPVSFNEAEIEALLAEIGEESEKPEIEFAEELLERHDYIVLKFDNEVDWLQAQTVFGVKTQAYTRGTHKAQHGIGRVIDGPTALNRILGDWSDKE